MNRERFSAPLFRTGFTLTELLISLMLVSIMAVTIGLAMFRTQQRTSQTRKTLVHIQSQNNVLDSICQELRWARSIVSLDAQTIKFVVKNVADGNDSTVEYKWNDTTNVLSRRVEGQAFKAVKENVNVFEFQQADFGWDDDNQRYLRSIKIEMQVASDSAGPCQRYVHFINQPYW